MKLVLFGRTGVGKSTLAASLGQTFGLDVLEADDEATRLNNGIWPDEEEAIDYYFELTNQQVLEMDSVLYVTSWLEPDTIVAFRQKGFLLVELFADFDTLLSRKEQRGDTIDEKQFTTNYQRHLEIINHPQVQPVLSFRLDTSRLSPTRVEEIIEDFLNTTDGLDTFA